MKVLMSGVCECNELNVGVKGMCEGGYEVMKDKKRVGWGGKKY